MLRPLRFMGIWGTSVTDWDAYERGRRDERERIRRAVDGDEPGCFSYLAVALIIYFIVKACSG